MFNRSFRHSRYASCITGFWSNVTALLAPLFRGGTKTKPSGRIKLTACCIILLILFCPLMASANQDVRIVPQLSLTDLNPRKVAFAPDDGDLLLVVNRHGRIDLLDISNPYRPVKTAELFAGAWDAAFIPEAASPPNGARIVSGGDDGSVRLWSLVGRQVGEPFQGHDHWVRSVAFSPDGQHIVSGGDDGTVRLWEIKSRESRVVYRGPTPGGLGFVGDRFFWIGGEDRIIIMSASFQQRGQLFLHRHGLFALLHGVGAYVPTDRVRDPFRAVAGGRDVVWQRGMVPEIRLERVRQVLLDDWTAWERVSYWAIANYVTARDWHDGLGWWRAVFWLVVLWSLIVATALALWIVVPHKLAHWSMPVAGRPRAPEDVPLWKKAAEILGVYAYLGRTRRSLKHWLRRNRDELYKKAFEKREPVRQSQTYCDLGHAEVVKGFRARAAKRDRGLVWIHGPGGGGKSALAYHMVREAVEARPRDFLPVLVDEDWEGSLARHVAALLRLNGRGPTEKMAETLGTAGLLCPIVDSLSERGTKDASKYVGQAAQEGVFRLIIVTSRSEPPQGQAWENFERVEARPVTPDRLEAYVSTYAPNNYGTVKKRVAPLFERNTDVSPLFLRFAIEQAQEKLLNSTSTMQLVRRYVDDLRKGENALGKDDMRRAAGIAAVTSVRADLVPREMHPERLLEALSSEADRMHFVKANPNGPMEPAEVKDCLIECGLLNRNQLNSNIQFAYDPVAEHLAVDRVFRVLPPDEAKGWRRRIMASRKPIKDIAKAFPAKQGRVRTKGGADHGIRSRRRARGAVA